MARRHDDEVAVIGVAARDDVDAMADFVERHDLGHIPHLADVDQQVWRRYDIPAQPAWVFVDGETGTVDTHLGPLDAGALDDRLTRLAD